MPKSSGIEEDLRVALNGYFFLDLDVDIDVYESLENLGMEVVPLLAFDAGRTRFADCMIVGEEADLNELVVADCHGIPLLGEPELALLLNGTPLEQITTSYSVIDLDVDAFVSADPLSCGPIELAEDLRRILSIIWDYHGRPSQELPIAVINSVEAKLGLQIPPTLLAYILATNADPLTTIQSLGGPYRLSSTDGYNPIDVAGYTPKGFLRLTGSGLQLPDGRGNETGCEFLVLHGRKAMTIQLKTWGYDHEGGDDALDIYLEDDFLVDGPSEADDPSLPQPGSYECMAWLEFGDTRLLYENEDSAPFQDKPFSQHLSEDGYVDIKIENSGFYHFGKKALLDLTGPGFDEFVPTIVKKASKQKFDVYHKKFGLGVIHKEHGKNIIEVAFEDGSVRKLARQFLEPASNEGN